MPRLAIISDTHVPSRADRIPEWVQEAVRSADHTVHAGDYDTEGAYRNVLELTGGDLTAVRGNMDPASIDAPTVATLSFGGVDFVVTHGSGPIHNYRRRIARTVTEEDPDAVGICGHTHETMDETVDGVRLLNPGSATGARPASTTSMLLADVEDGELDVLLRERE